MFLIRLDDASEYMNIKKWTQMEQLLDQYHVKPIFGIIPHNEDPELIAYGKAENFWRWAQSKEADGWIPALHGYNHVYESDCGGLNPVNRKSEFAGVAFEMQCMKIRRGYQILREHGIEPEIFFAPAHTFDENTLKALEKETPIRVISDTVAGDIYYREPFYYIPQQSGRVRRLPFKITTFCYHPNTMDDHDFKLLDLFLKDNISASIAFHKSILKKRKMGMVDRMFQFLYFVRRNCKQI